MTHFIAYYRVSTRRQGDSGYGLDAQREAVRRHLEHQTNASLIAEYTEVESGTKTERERPQLAAALNRCQLTADSVLIVAKLDRLARNAGFLHRLRDAGINFVCCDMPSANRLTIGILAEVAEDEAKRISTRTREGLAAAKARGVKLGTSGANRTVEHTRKMAVASSAQRTAARRERYARLLPVLRQAQRETANLSDAAVWLNQRHVKTLSGRGEWDRHGVQKVLNARDVPTPEPKGVFDI